MTESSDSVGDILSYAFEFRISQWKPVPSLDALP